MIGKKIDKKNYSLDEYSKTAKWCNENNATIIDKGEFYEVCEIPEPTEEERNAAEIERLKAELASTDYKTLKYIDGAITDEEYAETKKHRAELRQKINELL